MSKDDGGIVDGIPLKQWRAIHKVEAIKIDPVTAIVSWQIDCERCRASPSAWLNQRPSGVQPDSPGR